MDPNTIFRIASMTKPITAVAAMILVEEARLRLDDPVDTWLPELANRQVLRAIDSPLDETVPAIRSITLRDLLTLRLGIGAVMEAPGTAPIQQAMEDGGVAPGPLPPPHDPDAWMRHLGELPLVHQPGEGWMYHTGFDVLGVLVLRVAGLPLESFFRERIFEPLGMADTAFHVPEAKIDRLSTCYERNTITGTLTVRDPARGGIWSRPPVFPAGGGGLVSTASDFLAFARMLLRMGQAEHGRILARPVVEVMTMDHITPRQKHDYPFFPGFWHNTGWGFGMEIITGRESVDRSPGSYGWAGGFNTHWYNDPAEDLTGMLLFQCQLGGPAPQTIDRDFWTTAYAAIDD
jgi:CubicO group peptidase (beta-lactamase class C family)